jgi:hypothetical protein
MSWVEKRHQTEFEKMDIPIHGLFFLDGDALDRVLKLGWTQNQKYPMIAFPSGKEFDLWESSSLKNGGMVHLFGEMDLPVYSTRDEAFTQAQAIAEQVGYVVVKRGDTQLEVIGHDDAEQFLITYDDTERRMVDVTPIREKRERPRIPLLDEASRSKLPPLYSNEHIGLNALAQVKFFSPDSGWTWYASEASAILHTGEAKSLQEVAPDDPTVEDIYFFGLVNGFELELGTFSLNELSSFRGGLGLGVERDLYFKPMTLKQLQEKHHRERGER